jgi:protein SCO1/2
MDRRHFLGGIGALPLLLSTPAVAAAPAATMSRTARKGLLPNVPLVTHQGRPVMFYDDLVRERTVLLNFFLVQCTDGRCPTAMGNLRKAQDILGERMGKDVFFLSITLQPLLDTPAALKSYAERFAPRPGWELLTGKPQDVERLRRGMGFFDPDPERDRDANNHTGMGRYGNDKLERWGMVSLRSSPDNIASTFRWLSL